jgi:hypothetical protein
MVSTLAFAQEGVPHPMSALDQKQTLYRSNPMSALPPKADIDRRQCDVRFVPIAEIGGVYSISSSASDINDAGIVSPSAFAVVRLMMNSNFVGCSTGRSPGFAPRRILSTYLSGLWILT